MSRRVHKCRFKLDRAGDDLYKVHEGSAARRFSAMTKLTTYIFRPRPTKPQRIVPMEEHFRFSLSSGR